ncbi:hypothetical protein A7982_12841 [Minicystis rosea]|nr:hypothetical protein A7982_12841 [Minicystis rosea]
MKSILRSMGGVCVFLGAGLVAGCAPETEVGPEPELDTPGAFVAQREGDGSITLLRTLEKLTVAGQDTLLFFSVYDASPTTWDEARELAKQHDLKLRYELTTAYETPFLTSEFRVVWFRTLTDEERDRLH